MTCSFPNFTHLTIPACIFLREDLHPHAKTIWAQIRSLHDIEKGGCFASEIYLCDFFKLSRTQLYVYLKQLRDSGLLESVKFKYYTLRIALDPEEKVASSIENISISEQNIKESIDNSEVQNDENRTSPVRKTGRLESGKPDISRYNIKQRRESKEEKEKEKEKGASPRDSVAPIFSEKISVSSNLEIQKKPKEKKLPPEPKPNEDLIERSPGVFVSEKNHKKLLELWSEEVITLSYEELSDWKENNPSQAKKHQSDYLRIRNWVANLVAKRLIEKKKISHTEGWMKSSIAKNSVSVRNKDIPRYLRFSEKDLCSLSSERKSDFLRKLKLVSEEEISNLNEELKEKYKKIIKLLEEKNERKTMV